MRGERECIEETIGKMGWRLCNQILEELVASFSLTGSLSLLKS